MLSRTRRRLTLLITLLTSVVLGLALISGCLFSQSQLQNTGERAFLSQFSQLCQRVSSGALQDSWLAAWEAENRAIVRFSEGGTPLFFQGGWEPAAGRAALFDAAQQAQAEAGVPFLVNGWRALYEDVPLAQGTCRVLALEDLTAERTALRATALWYLGVFAAGAAALAAVSHVLSGFALKPVAQNLRRQAEFISAAGHELRTPVAAVAAALSAMEECPAETPRWRAAAQAETGRLARLTEDLLTLANADAAHWKWRPALLDTDALLIDAAEQLRPLCPALVLDLPPAPLLPVWGDRDRLTQLLAVLTDNAARYNPPGMPLTLRARLQGKMVVLSVEDHGPGVPDAEKQRVFERFARGGGTDGTKNHFGLGLAVAKELASLHGGTLAVQDTPGGGATFILKLPAAK